MGLRRVFNRKRALGRRIIYSAFKWPFRKVGHSPVRNTLRKFLYYFLTASVGLIIWNEEFIVCIGAWMGIWVLRGFTKGIFDGRVIKGKVGESVMCLGGLIEVNLLLLMKGSLEVVRGCLQSDFGFRGVLELCLAQYCSVEEERGW